MADYRPPLAGYRLLGYRLLGALHLSRAKTPRTHVDTLRGTVYEGFHTPDVRQPLAGSLDIRVTDLSANMWAFAANLAAIRHNGHLLVLQRPGLYCIIATQAVQAAFKGGWRRASGGPGRALSRAVHIRARFRGRLWEAAVALEGGSRTWQAVKAAFELSSKGGGAGPSREPEGKPSGEAARERGRAGGFAPPSKRGVHANTIAKRNFTRCGECRDGWFLPGLRRVAVRAGGMAVHGQRCQH